MGAQNIIGLGFDIDTLTAQKKQVLEEVIDLFEKLEKYDGTKLNPLGPGGLNDLRKSIKDGAAAMGDYQAQTSKYIQTVNEQVAQQKQLTVSYSTATASLKENAALLAGLQVQQKANSDTQKQLKKDYDAGILSLDEYKDKVGEIIKEQFALKQSIADATKEIVNQSRAEFVPANSKDDAIAQNKILTKQVNSTDVNDVERVAQLNALIDRNNQLIDENSDKLAKQKINIGNYAGAFKVPFEVLKDQLAAVKEQMSQIEAKGKVSVNTIAGFDPNRFKNKGGSSPTAGDGPSNFAGGDATAYQELANRAQVLEKGIERVSIGFKTSRQEAAAFKEIAIQVGQQVGQEDEQFLKLNQAVGGALNEFNDLKAATKFQAQDAKTIVGLANAASTLAAGFGAAQAAASLFGNESEDLQKQMARFQQILLLINSLQQIANGLQEESAGVQLLLGFQTKLNAAAEAARNLIRGKAVAIIQAETASELENAAAKEVNVVATGELVVAEEAQTVAAVENTAANVANSVAQKGAATASKGLGASLGTGGVAGLSLAAGIGLALLTAKLIGFGKQTHITAEQQKELAEATKDLMDALDGQAKILETLDSAQGKYYSNQIADAQAAGAAQAALLLLQQRSDQTQADAAKREKDRLGASDKGYSDAAHGLQILQDQQQAYSENLKKLESIPKEDRTSTQNDLIEDTKKRIEANAADLSNAQKHFDDMTAARKAFDDFTHKAEEDGIKFTKLAFDEQLDVIEKTEELRANLVKAKNAIILGDDRSSLAQRLAALRSNTKQENDILDAQVAKVKNNPSNYLNGLLTPEAQLQVDAANEKRKENLLSGLENQRKITEDYRLRNLNADIEANKILIQEDLDKNKAIVDNDDKSLEERIDSYRKYYDDQRILIEQDFTLRLKSADFSDEEVAAVKAGNQVRVAGKKITDQELLKEEIDYQSKLVGLNNSTQKDINAIITSWAKKNADAVALANKQNDTSGPENQYNKDVTALNDSLAKKLISVREYQQKRKILDETFGISQLADQVSSDDKSLAALKKNDEDIQAEIQKNRLDLVKAYENGDQKQIDSAIEAQKDLQDAADQSNAAIIAGTIKKNEDLKKLNDKVTSDYLDLKKQESDAEINLGKQTAQLGENLINAGYEKEINRLQKQIDANNKLKEAETTRINNSTLSEQEKANSLIILGKQADAQNEALQKKQRDEKVKEAKFDKAVKVAEIGGSTAVAVISLAQKEAEAQAQAALLAANPITAAYAPVAAASAAVIGTLIGLTIASGAAQIAAVLATPVPAYRHGTADHPGGLAVVGDGREKELIKEPGKQAYWSPAVPTTLELRPHTQVLPLSRISDMISQGMFVNNSGILVAEPDHTAEKIDKLNNTIIWLGSVVKESAKINRPRVIIKNTIGSDLAHAAFIRKNVLD